MPTRNRREFVPLAIRYFLRQDYSERELIVVDDGTDPVGDLLPLDERIRYVLLPPRASVGAKRNLACELARGEIVVHWDDDDWQAPHRLSVQARALRESGADVCGIRRVPYFDRGSGEAWEYVYANAGAPWLAGSALAYRREFWRTHRSPDLDVGEDNAFLAAAGAGRLHALAGAAFHVGIIHRGNVSPKRALGPSWHRSTRETIERIAGDDLAYYANETALAVLAAWQTPFAPPLGALRPAREAELARPEYAAFAHGAQLPRMRRWELPFALWSAALEPTSSVLDCSINPAGFGERIASLYPHVLYRHLPALRDGRFAPPLGVPDAAFDRVVCVNTLEHLLRDQRAALLHELARKLKPGGLLVITADAYFASAWDEPALLASGLVRADRAEVVNGCNAVTGAEIARLCAAAGLHAADPNPPVEPVEGDRTLFLQDAPYGHAVVGGTFTKGPLRAPRRPRLVLALLTWNTRAVSMESLAALAREARTLERLGCDASLCVVDNGSADGTAADLHALDATLDVAHRFVCNDRNLGSSVARNQIIDHALDVAADYVLFVDGDIEPIPFSSFAMLRYMEDAGRLLGCVGAWCAGFTEDRAQASPFLYSLAQVRLAPTTWVAWTQYGLFRTEMFARGVRFDTGPPFDEPGWGFEDNDLAFQMEMQGYANHYFTGATYLHRQARSSIRIMRRHGLDPQPPFDRRRQYLLDKWSAVPRIATGPLLDVQRCTALPA
jgi:glycosyltransferase involved in cell wall biosynthesis